VLKHKQYNMQHTTKTSVDSTKWDEDGCFVFQVHGGDRDGGVEVRKGLDVSDLTRTGLDFHHGELVACDLIRHSRVPYSANGPYLRLADHTGWLFVHKHGTRRMRQVPVKIGLWAFFVDNFPVGQHLRRHPTDRRDLLVFEQLTDEQNNKPLTYMPQQKIYCDRKVTHPDTQVNYYRVQGTTGWVFDQRGENIMLIDASRIRTGLFAYRALTEIAIRSQTYLGDEYKTKRSVQQHDIVAVDVVRESPYPHGNGPFLRLTDGAGWLFEQQRHEVVMKEIPVEVGSWSFKALYSVSLKRHPMAGEVQSRIFAPTEWEYPRIFAPEECILCDRKISCRSEKGAVNCYRVMNSDGWIRDMETSGRVVLELYWTGPSMSELDSASAEKGVGWSPDFVRGVAVTVHGLKEILFDQVNKLLSFRAADGIRINVYYADRTVGTAVQDPVYGKTQLFRRDCSADRLADIMKNPRAHSGQGYKKSRKWEENASIMQTSIGSGIAIKDEEIVRTALAEVDGEMTKLHQKRIELLQAAKVFDDERTARAKLDMERYRDLLE
jgi:hypothetical protein